MQVAQGEYVAPDKLQLVYSKSYYISQVQGEYSTPD